MRRCFAKPGVFEVEGSVGKFDWKENMIGTFIWVIWDGPARLCMLFLPTQAGYCTATPTAMLGNCLVSIQRVVLHE